MSSLGAPADVFRGDRPPALPTEGDMLLRDICAHPADDAPRLIFADWLDEHGQLERAEFIRVQCEISRWLKIPCSIAAGTWERDRISPRHLKAVEWSEPPPARCGLPLNDKMDMGLCHKCARIELLLERHRELQRMPADKWHMVNYPVSILAETKVKLAPFWRMERGFVHQMSVSVWTWEEYGPYIVSRQPIESLELVDVFPHMRAVYGIDRPCLYPVIDLSTGAAYAGRARYPLKLTPALLAVEGVADSAGVIYCDGNQKALFDKACGAALTWARREAGLEGVS